MTNELQAALAAILKRIGDKTGDREALPQGANYEAQLTVTGTLNGEPVAEGYDAKLAVGYDKTGVASGKTPAGDLLAYLLKDLNEATREARLRDIARDFAGNGNKLPCDPELAKRCDNALKAVRATVGGTKRGDLTGPVNRVPVQDYRMVPQGEVRNEKVNA